MKTLKPFWLTRTAVFALALSVFVACDDSTEPTGDIDTEAAATAMDDVVGNFFDDNDALQSIGVLGEAMQGALGGPSIAPFDLIPNPKDRGAYAIATSFRASVAEMAEDGPPRLPVGVLGKTFVFDGEGYVIDPDSLDAPANGVRFMLYAVDPILGQPISPLTSIGYIEIVDTSSFPTINIGMTAVVGGTTLIDVDVSGTFGETTFTLNFGGFVSDGTDQLTFGFNVFGSETEFSILFSIAFGGYTIRFDFSGDDTGAGSISATLTDPGNNNLVFSLTIDALGDIATGSGVFLNGGAIALISGNINGQVVITNATGGELSAAELQLLEDIFMGMNEMFEVFEDLVEFAFFLILLGLI